MDRLTQLLRNRIVSALHLELVRPGERLPSIRELSRDLEVDHRAVARAYHLLQEEGLVEIRGRAGVFAAVQDAPSADVTRETGAWLANTLAEAWRRNLDAAALQQLIRRATRSTDLTCVCLESTMDHLVSYEDELVRVLRLRVVPVKIPAGALRAGAEGSAAAAQAIRGADLALTTPHHAAFVRPLADAAAVPLVLANVEPVMLQRVDQLVASGKLTLIIADPAFGARIRAAYRERGQTIPASAVIAATERERIASLPASQSVLITRAAKQVLSERDVGHLVAQAPTLSVETIRELAEIVIERNLAASGPATAARRTAARC